MNHFSMPADFKKETIDKYVQLNKAYKDSKVFETYGNITIKNAFESGRPNNNLPQVDLSLLAEYAAYSNLHGINFNYTLNSSHLHNKEFTKEGLHNIYRFLGELKRIGIDSLTIALPSLLDVVANSGYDFELKISVISQVTNPNKANSFKKIGADRIVVDESINRDFKTLRAIVDSFGEGIEVIVNTICHKDCIYRPFHYNQIASDAIEVTCKASLDYYSHRCLLRRYEDVGAFFKLSWIRPEDMEYYRNVGIRHFKLQGRQVVLNGDPARTVEYYFKQSYDGDLIKLLEMFASHSSFNIYIDNKKLDGFIRTFYEHGDFCKHRCEICNYCNSFAKKCLDEEEVKKMYGTTYRFYSEFDEFNKLVHSLKKNNDKILASNPQEEVDYFDFQGEKL